MLRIGKYRHLALLLIWMSLIFTLSSQSGLAVGGTPTVWFYLERKGAHVFEYLVLTFLAYRFFRAPYRGSKWNVALLLSVALSLLYGMSDEIHQTFVPGREGKISDVGIDSIGIALFVCGYAFLKWNKNRAKIMSKNV